MIAKKLLNALELTTRFLSWVAMFGIPVLVIGFLLGAPFSDIKVEPMWAIMFSVLALVLFHSAIHAWNVSPQEGNK